mmetsp:Transcript_4488/g.5631  ORF Transcript_4488/g.5631 Transcript_4488/m.5631 type:complete len:243 (-) Transcript_4488:82-810(-)
MANLMMRNVFSCCLADETSIAEEISYATDPKLDEGTRLSLQLPTTSPGHLHRDLLHERRFPGAGDISARSSGQDSAPFSARSWSPEDKQKEKERLQDIVREFAKAVVDGQQCQWLDSRSGPCAPRPAKYFIDRSMRTFTLRPENGPEVQFGMASIVEVLKDYESTAFADYKGAATGYHTGSDLMERCFVCVQYTDSSAEDTNSDVDNNLGMLMQNQYERERFYTCMKILKWATESRRDKQSV